MCGLLVFSIVDLVALANLYLPGRSHPVSRVLPLQGAFQHQKRRAEAITERRRRRSRVRRDRSRLNMPAGWRCTDGLAQAHRWAGSEMLLAPRLAARFARHAP